MRPARARRLLMVSEMTPGLSAKSSGSHSELDVDVDVGAEIYEPIQVGAVEENPGRHVR